MVGFGSVGYGIQETPLEPEGSFSARQNTILRAYFRKRSSKIISSHNTPNWRHDLFVEKFVDQQIDYFLSQLQEKLSLLRFHFSRVEASLVTLLEAPSSQEQQLAHLQWENSLREVERYSGDAWNLLRYVFTGLEDRDRFTPRFSSYDMETVVRQQLDFMGEEIVEAERKIQHYFFQSGSTVLVEDLRDGNMVINLYHVRQMAEKLNCKKC